MRFTCQMCGQCCRIYTVPVTSSDINRIAEFTGLDPRKFLMTLVPDESVAGTYFDIAKIRFRDGEGNVLALKQDGDACMFLKDNKCSVYPARPLICRPFPFHYTIDNARTVTFTINEKAYNFCKGVGRGSRHSVLDDLKKTVLLMEEESETFRKNIEEWNKKVSDGKADGAGLDDLLKFLL